MSTATGGFEAGSTKSIEEREEEGQVVHIEDELGELLYFSEGGGAQRPVTMTVVGAYSETFRRAEEALTQKNLRRRGQLTAQELRRQRLELLAACVKDWQGFHENGDLLPCERARVVDVLRRAPWIKQQVESAIEDHDSFFGKGSTAS